MQDWSGLRPDQHESLAAFRVRFSECQEHMGKTMKAVALEEEKPAEPFTVVLFYMEKLGCLDSVERWKELRNAVSHEYEDDPKVLHEFFEAMLASVPSCCAGTTSCWPSAARPIRADLRSSPPASGPAQACASASGHKLEKPLLTRQQGLHLRGVVVKRKSLPP